ncbi:MAG: UxaA family hydrolase [Bacteroidetes bacterium]|nr:UxaA family hydrolase [Bacteroidota bacterium]
MKKYIQLHPSDNVLIVIDTIKEGEYIEIDETEIYIKQSVPVGHKIAACTIKPEESIIKYGVPIGLATQPINKGDYVHIHNVKSAYIPTYTLQTTFIETPKTLKK